MDVYLQTGASVPSKPLGPQHALKMHSLILRMTVEEACKMFPGYAQGFDPQHVVDIELPSVLGWIEK